jgi:hypothetical protein
MVQSSYFIRGIIASAGAGVTVTGTNSRTGKTLTTITAVDGSYLLDCADFASGYNEGDTITISVSGYVSGSVEINITSREDGRLVSLSQPLFSASNPFSAFDWPYPIVKIAVTPGYTNQTTGAWVAETTEETAITAHVSDISIKERSYLEPGLVERGVRNLSCDSSLALAVGDRVKITELAGDTSEWMIHTKKISSGLLARHAGISRESFVLKRKA